ncbi:MAG: hypothetical protein P8L74_03605 [Gammaproteobacteria bacterium]|nr:hypothetical protein [Gammaproteobacteria bacterium]
MKKLILISALLFSFNGWAQVSDEIHQRCKDAADYVGCIQVFTGSIPTKKANDSEADLKKALKLLPRRLENTSLRDFSSAIQPFTDALALAETDDAIGDSQLVRDSRKIDYALSVARSAWDASIEASVEMSSSSPMFTTLARTNSCSVLNREVGAFNASLGGHAMNYPCSSEKGNLLTIKRNENAMISIIRQAALDTANGKALNYSQFISVEEHYEREKIRDDEWKKQNKERKQANKKKPKIKRRDATKKMKRLYEIGSSALIQQSKYRNEMKELCDELTNASIKFAFHALDLSSTSDKLSGHMEYLYKYNCSFYLIGVFMIEEDYEKAKEQIEILLLTDLDGKDAEYWNKLTLSNEMTFINTVNESKKQLEELLIEISINNEEAIQKRMATMFPQTL